MAVNDTDELATTARIRGVIPSNYGSWTTANVLNEGWRQLVSHHLPMLMNARGEYLVKTTNIQMVSGTEMYRLSHRAAGIRHVAFLGTDSVLRPTSEMNPEEQAQWRAQPTRTDAPRFYEFAEQSLRLWPIPNITERIRVKWFMRPSRLVSYATDAAVITGISIGATSTVLTFAANPPSGATIWSTGTKNDAGTLLYDIVKRSSPFDTLAYDITKTATAATTLTFLTADVPSTVGIGDVVTPANYSAFAQIPVELHLPLALRTAAAILKPKGDGLSPALEEEAKDEEERLLNGLLVPRSKGNVRRLASRRW